MPRQIKQVIAAGIFCIIVFLLGFGVYKIVVPAKPSPTPNPTAHLSPIVVVSTKLLNVKNNDYDFIAKVSNANTEYGSGNVQYELKFSDPSGDTVSTKIGSFYILPGQTRYIIITPLSFNTSINHADFKINSVYWQRLDPLFAQGINLVPKNVNFSQPGRNSVFAGVGGGIANISDFDFDVVDVTVVVLDFSGNPIAANKTIINTFLARTERGFEASWFTPFVGQVQRTDVQAGTNVFNNSNFLRRYGSSERFQTFY